jgi:hypothetical protein
MAAPSLMQRSLLAWGALACATAAAFHASRFKNDAAKRRRLYPTNASRIRANMPGCLPAMAARM